MVTRPVFARAATVERARKTGAADVPVARH